MHHITETLMVQGPIPVDGSRGARCHRPESQMTRVPGGGSVFDTIAESRTIHMCRSVHWLKALDPSTGEGSPSRRSGVTVLTTGPGRRPHPFPG